MKKTALVIGICLWSLLALLLFVALVFGATGNGAPDWVRNLPGYRWNVNVNFGGNAGLIGDESFLLDGIDLVIVDASYQRINVTIGGEKLNVRHYDYGSINRFSAERVDGSLRIRTDRTPLVSVGIMGAGARLEITIPRAYTQNVSFTSTSGSVRVDGGADWEGVSLRSTSGSIRVHGDLKSGGLSAFSTSGSVRLEGSVKGKEITIGSTSGSVRVEGRIEGESLKAQSTSGSIRIGDCAITGSVGLQSSSGSINTGHINAGTITSATTSGSQRLGNFVADGMIEITSVSGSVRIGDVNSPEHRIRSTSGSITTGRLAGSGNITSVSGRVRTE
jgi:DUF4097 and DUF4098 domain-containing protein YvlB